MPRVPSRTELAPPRGMQILVTEEGGRPLVSDSVAISYRRQGVRGFLAELALRRELTTAILTAPSASP
ncbi:MAG: hypothetical protein EOM37_20470 [Proteobacteria bacterium]|nr:hypothetical protein [Pseudomonadota bacterium]